MPPLAPGTTIDGFVVESVLGQGAMGVVYKAREAGTGRAVALKMILPGAVGGDGVARFQREAKAALAVRHANVVAALATGSHQGVPYFVSELVPGGSLGAHLAARGRLPWTEAVALAAAIADGLAAVHAAGLVHRDLKPDNILLGAAGEPRIADLGLARHVPGGGPATTAALTKTGELLGTPSYMSPEQADGQRAVDARADVYALGCIVFALVTGAPPFEGGVLEVVKKHLLATPPALRDRAADAPRALDQLVRRLLEKDPARRPQSAAQVAAELRNVAPVTLRGSPLAVVCLVFVAAAAATAIAVAARGPSRPVSGPPPPIPPATPQAPAPLAPVAPPHSRPVPAFLDGVARTAKGLTLAGAYGTIDRHCGGPIRQFDVDRELRAVFVTGDDLHLRLFDLDTGRERSATPFGWSCTAAAVVPGRREAVVVPRRSPGQPTVIWLKSLEAGGRSWEAELPFKGVPSTAEVGALAVDTARGEVYAVDDEGRFFILDLEKGTLRGEALPFDGLADRACLSLAIAKGRVIAALKDGSIRVVDLATRTVTQHDGHGTKDTRPNQESTAVVACVDVASDGRHLVTASHDGTLILRDAADGHLVQRFKPEGATSRFHYVRFLSDGRRVLAAREDATLWLWTPGGAAVPVPCPWGDLAGLYVVGPRAYLASGGGYHEVDLTKDTPVVEEPTTCCGSVKSLGVGAGERRLLAFTLDGSASVWDLATGEQKRLPRRDESSENAAAISPDGRLAATGGFSDGLVVVRDLDRGTTWEAPAKSRQCSISDLAFVDQERVAFVRRGIAYPGEPQSGGTLEVWSRGKQGLVLSPSPDWVIERLAVLRGREPRYALLGRAPRKKDAPRDAPLKMAVRVVEANVPALKLGTEELGVPAAIAASATHVAFAGLQPSYASYARQEWPNARVLLVKADRQGAQSPKAVVSDHAQSAFGLAFSPDGTILAVAARDAGVRLFSTAGDTPEIASIHLGSITDCGGAVAFAPDGRTLYVGTTRGLILRLTLKDAR